MQRGKEREFRVRIQHKAEAACAENSKTPFDYR